MSGIQLVSRVAIRAGRFARRRLFPRAPHDHSGQRQVFAIGIYIGTSPLELRSVPEFTNPVLTARDITDRSADYVADPFLLHVNSTWHMFFEVFNRESKTGEIGLATSSDALQWSYRGIVVSDSIHLSYPHVFCWQDQIYMMPETGRANAVRLYRASDFPFQWQCVGDLLSGERFLDATPFEVEDRWYILVETGEGLKLFTARQLEGPYREHPRTPLVTGRHASRPAGRVIQYGDKLYRCAQNCLPVYGSAVRLFEISTLNETAYEEREATALPVLSGSDSGWNADGMHHMDAQRLSDDRWIASVDGWAWR